MRRKSFDWDAYLMGHAVHAAKASKDSTKVGAVLISPERVPLVSCFNGPPQGVQDEPVRFDRTDGVKYLYASHAEQNVIAFAARYGIRTADMNLVTTHHPCSSCAKSIIQAGIALVIAGDGSTSMPAAEFIAAETMFKEACVAFRRVYLAEEC